LLKRDPIKPPIFQLVIFAAQQFKATALNTSGRTGTDELEHTLTGAAR
jgi:hypothetical protein